MDSSNQFINRKLSTTRNLLTSEIYLTSFSPDGEMGKSSHSYEGGMEFDAVYHSCASRQMFLGSVSFSKQPTNI